jgi:hypothetical protein
MTIQLERAKAALSKITTTLQARHIKPIIIRSNAPLPLIAEDLSNS